MIELKPCGDWATFNGFGAGIFKADPDQLHIGMLYSRAQDVFFYHLAFHKRLLNDLATTHPKLQWANSGLTEEDATTMHDLVRKLASIDYKPAYGWDSNGEAFDRVTDEPLPLPDGRGFTCATFILAVHLHRGIELLDPPEKWPSRLEDAIWQTKIIERLEHYCKSHGMECADHVESLKKQIGAARYRPEEVFAGATAPDTELPLTFDEARAIAEDVVSQLS